MRETRRAGRQRTGPLRARSLLFLSLAAPLLLSTASPAVPMRSTPIEDFESGTPVLESYPGQDAEPSAWEISTADPYGGAHALRLFGNTWKTQAVSPIAVTDSTV